MKQLRTVQVGLGLIGGTVIDQIVKNRDAWKDRFSLEVGVAAIVSSKNALLAGPAGFTSGHLADIVTLRRDGADLTAIGTELGIKSVSSIDFDLSRLGLDRPIVLDAAAGSATTALSIAALNAEGGVVYSNKAPLAQDTSESLALWNGVRSSNVRYETTCGAGLPVISTIKSLLATGDEVIQIVGCLSGTLGAIFSDIASGQPLAAAIRAAKDAGYTEPDPRDDLSGLDVARKALILARTMGRTVDLADIAVESLVPAALADCSVSTFMERIADYNASMTERQQRAQATGATLKYIATIPAFGPIKVGVESVPTTTVLGALQGPENIISIQTARYDRYPLTISGPGAGAEVTAAGMIADMLEIARAG